MSDVLLLLLRRGGWVFFWGGTCGFCVWWWFVGLWCVCAAFFFVFTSPSLDVLHKLLNCLPVPFRENIVGLLCAFSSIQKEFVQGGDYFKKSG